MAESSDDRIAKLGGSNQPVVPWQASPSDPQDRGDGRPPKKAARQITQARISGEAPTVGTPTGGELGKEASASDPPLEFDLDSVPVHMRGPLTGQLLEDRYLIKEKLGEGGMGVVYRAEHTLMRKEMAVKVLLPEFGHFDGIVKRFHREAQSASRLEHPGIIHINDFGRTKDGLLFLAMEFLDGRSLTDLIREQAPLPHGAAVRIAQQVALALEHAHNQGVVHRDLKPDNIMLVTKGSHQDLVKILDFGIAKITEGDGAAEGLTEAGMVFGTPEYLSPEQASGEAADARADVYALGIMLWEMLGGRRPFRAPKKMQLIAKHIHEKAPSLRKEVPEAEVPVELDRVVLKALEKSPEDRYQSAGEFFQALSALDVAETSTMSFWAPTTMVGPTPAALPRKSRAGLIVLLVFLLLGGGAAAAWFLHFGKKKDEGGGERPPVAGIGATAASAETLAAIETLLKAGKVKEARKASEKLVDKHPTDVRVHMLRARVYSRSLSTWDETLRAYQQVIRLDKKKRADPVLQSHIYDLLTRNKGVKHWSIRRKAMSFVERYMDETGVKMMVKFIKDWWEPPLLWRAVKLLQKWKAEDKIDYPGVYLHSFRYYKGCPQRLKYLKEIKEFKKDRKIFVPLLRKLLAEKYFKRSIGGRVYNACIQKVGGEVLRDILDLPGEDDKKKDDKKKDDKKKDDKKKRKR